ncbi:MAG: precorrin-2 C(20)-methyltransferase [Rhodospirillales bacterium]
MGLGQTMNEPMNGGGTLYGVGVGPGDPDLLTLKAIKVIAAAAVIAYPAAENTESLARAIAGPHIPAGKTEIAIVTPMVPGRFPANDVYDSYAQDIAAHLSAGRDVAVLCEGDPFLYGSFMYLFLRLADRFPAQVVPGVSSLAACAAVAGAPLVSRNQVLTVIPGPLDEDDLEARLAGTEAAAIMKVGRHLPKVRAVIEKLGRLDRAQYVEHATMADQVVLPLRDAPDTAPYFSMILVRSPEDVESPQ